MNNISIRGHVFLCPGNLTFVLYLEVEIQPHVVVPYLDHLVPGCGQMAAIL